MSPKSAQISRATVQPLEAWEREAELRLPARRDFRAALAARAPAIIAEIKKASPSKGVLSHDFDPPRIARAYESGGAAALSVLTDETFFQGSLADLQAARAAVSLPVLRKDFTIDPSQILEAAAHGADAILLIAAILSARQIRDFREIAARYRLSALVEVHNRRELDAAIEAGADLIGVNNRNLSTFEVTLDTSLALAEHMPPGALLVSESGIHDAADIVRLRAAGYHAFLVGEHLMKSGDPAAALRDAGGRMISNAILKVCGITNQPDADAAIAAGATAIGFNFYPKSPRYIAPEVGGPHRHARRPPRRRVRQRAAASASRTSRASRRSTWRNCTATKRPPSIRPPSPSGKPLASPRTSIFRNWTTAPPKPSCSMAPLPNSTAAPGMTFDWTLARNARHRIILAGGLDASNVARAISLAQPWGVDSCSRIESSPGIKDHMKMIDFLHAAKAALRA